jgi:hypothetical protein
MIHRLMTRTAPRVIAPDSSSEAGFILNLGPYNRTLRARPSAVAGDC